MVNPSREYRSLTVLRGIQQGPKTCFIRLALTTCCNKITKIFRIEKMSLTESETYLQLKCLLLVMVFLGRGSWDQNGNVIIQPFMESRIR